mgnify:CR=1 FL=1
MKTNPKIKKALALSGILAAACEGYSEQPYVDLAGFMTTGTGHKITGHETTTDPEKLFRQDVETALSCVDRNAPDDLTAEQMAAVADLAYNMGCSGMLKTTFFAQLRRGQFDENALLDINKVHGNTVRGLTVRRAIEACLYKHGDLQDCLRQYGK